MNEFHITCLVVDEDHWYHYGSQEEIAIDYIFESRIHDFANIVLSKLDLKHGKASFVGFDQLSNEVKACNV